MCRRYNKIEARREEYEVENAGFLLINPSRNIAKSTSSDGGKSSGSGPKKRKSNS